jgi:transcriptional regulator with XRE-family HTH domain
LKTIREVFSANLVRLRGERTQQQIADLAGIPFPSYRDCEYGKVPQPANLAAIAKAFGVAESALFLDPDLTAPTPQQAIEVLTRLVASLTPETLGLLQSLAALDDVKRDLALRNFNAFLAGINGGHITSPQARKNRDSA